MVNRSVVDEIVALDALRVQKVFGLLGHILVLELFSLATKRIYLVFDHNPQTQTFHVQKERPVGPKSQSPLVALLNKYATDQYLRFFKLDEEGSTIKAIFSRDGENFSLIFETSAGFFVGLFCASKLLAFMGKRGSLAFREGYLITESETSGIECNLAQAKKYHDALLAYDREAIFTSHMSNLKRDIAKKKALIKNVTEDLRRCETALSLLDSANLLKANFHLVTRGMKEVFVTDYSKDPPAQKLVVLDPKLTPQDFLNKTFNKIKKAKRGIGIISTRLANIREEMAQLEQQLDEMSQLGPLDIPTNVIDVKGDVDNAPKRTTERVPYRSFMSSDQIPIFVGKSAKDSDILTRRFARGNEWWLHARDVAGAHVVIKSSLDELPPRTLIEAAMLAHHFSKNRDAEASTIQYTRIKFVHKKKGFPPGKVLVTQEKTIDIKSDPDRIKKLLG